MTMVKTVDGACDDVLCIDCLNCDRGLETARVRVWVRWKIGGAA